MADEAQVRASLSIRKTSGAKTLIDYRSSPSAFNSDVTGTKGPTPGALTIPTGGKVVSFAELDTPGWCILHNEDATNYVEWGVYDPDTDRFYPVGEIGPGESAGPFKFSRNFREDYIGTGTGTSSEGGNQFFMKADTADVVVSVEALEA